MQFENWIENQKATVIHSHSSPKFPVTEKIKFHHIAFRFWSGILFLKWSLMSLLSYLIATHFIFMTLVKICIYISCFSVYIELGVGHHVLNFVNTLLIFQISLTWHLCWLHSILFFVIFLVIYQWLVQYVCANISSIPISNIEMYQNYQWMCYYGLSRNNSVCIANNFVSTVSFPLFAAVICRNVSCLYHFHFQTLASNHVKVTGSWKLFPTFLCFSKYFSKFLSTNSSC